MVSLHSPGIWSQVGLLTLAARDPASPSSPLASLKLGYGCGFQIPTPRKVVFVAPSANKKAPLRVLFNWRRGRDLNPRNLAVYRFSRPAVSTTHTPLQLRLFRVAELKRLFLLYQTLRPLVLCCFARYFVNYVAFCQTFLK